MSRNTNTLFWVICGAIVVLTIYLVIVAEVPNTIKNILDHNNKTVEVVDDGSTPTKSTVKSSESTNNSFAISYAPTKNTSRYRCDYGTEKGKMDNTGIVYIDKDKIVCKASHLKSATKYYVQLSSINNNIAIKSDIVSVITK